MKKIIALVLAAVFAATLFTGCKSGTENNEKSVKTGLAVITSIAKSTSAGETDGYAQADSVIVAVTVDANGKIVKCVIDTAQSKVDFDSSGQLITPMNTVFQTKNELGDNYGMKKASSIGKEWYEQAAALAKYVEGKNVAEVKNIAVDDSMHATGSDLKASITVSIGGYIDAISKAVANAKDYGAKASDALKIGVSTNMGRSASAGDEAGLAQIYSTYVVTTTDASGKITSCIIDASQSDINFDASGKITSDLNAAPQTKNEIGDKYGMKKASSIGKEWYEQAAAFAKYVTGKTASEVAGIAVDEKGAATNSDIKASVTIGIADFKAALAKAA